MKKPIDSIERVCYNTIVIRFERSTQTKEGREKMVKLTLEAWRVNAGLTQKEASKLLKVSNTTLCNWETGKSHPSSKKIDLICEVYGCHYDNINFLPNNSL